MRPIDADRLLKAFCGHCEDYENCKTTCFDFRIIQTQPTVDAVPVVRCKDCKWYQLDPWKYKVQCEKIYDVADGDLDAFNFRPAPEHFCAYGERKEGMSDGEKQ